MNRSGQVLLSLILAATVCSAIGYLIVRPTPIKCHSQSSCSYTIDLPYDEVRTRLVRGELTTACIEAAGCRVVDTEIVERDIDLSKDPKPLINALKRKSKSTVKQKQMIVVEVKKEQLETDNLKLLQSATITPKGFEIQVRLFQASGLLADYEYVILGKPKGEFTEVSFQLRAVVQKQVSGVAHPWVPEKVHAEVDKALVRQARTFVDLLQSDAPQIVQNVD
ncbi:MAG: hypothetical protein U0930_04335 [Pirellulales bacterium]